MKRDLQRALTYAAVLVAVGLSYLIVAHISYAHGYDAGYHAIECEANQD